MQARASRAAQPAHQAKNVYDGLEELSTATEGDRSQETRLSKFETDKMSPVGKPRCKYCTNAPSSALPHLKARVTDLPYKGT